MEIEKLSVYEKVTTYKVKNESFEGLVLIADQDGLVYVRKIYPSRGGEVLQCFNKTEAITGKVIEYHNSLKNGKETSKNL